MLPGWQSSIAGMAMNEHVVRMSARNGIAFLELCNPPGNAMNMKFFDQFCSLERSFGDRPVRGMIVTGTGRHFSSGADIDELKRMVTATPHDIMSRSLLRNHQAFETLARLPFPVVAAISGCCLGAGLELALACRFRVAAPRAVFSLPETSFGLIPGCGGTVRLPPLVGAGRAIELILSGRSLLADEALEIGLVDRVVEKDLLFTAATELIGKGK